MVQHAEFPTPASPPARGPSVTQQTDRLRAALDGRYRIERELGAGGMATVYLAEDIKHDRRVALKLLKPELAAVLGAERFVQEIKTTAALQHPHILPLFDSGTVDGFLFYVMPYIQGETLRDKLNRETQLGVDEAVAIARDVAGALDYAHRHGVIHRDIKPENILLHDGRPMVADFGIALALSAAAGGRMTETGLSLGTPHYMSPEQATAEKDITARSDVYSIASVLYEMLTGDPPHTGASAQQIIMKIITEAAAPVTQLRKSVPANVAAALARALEKLPADRFASAKLFADALADPAYTDMGRHTVGTGRRAGATSATAARWGWLGWAVGAAGLAIGAWSAWGGSERAGASVAPMYLDLALPDSAAFAGFATGIFGAGPRALTISGDGRILVYVALEGSRTRLHLRRLDGFDATPIAGTEDAYYPFLSPDGEWVAFFVGSELRKVPLAGGPVVPLSVVPEAVGAAWSRDGRILVSAREGDLLGWVPETGGPIRPIPNPQRLFRSQPFLLADGRAALVFVDGPGVDAGLGMVDLESGRAESITLDGPVAADASTGASVIRGSQPQLLRSGELLYVTPTGLMAVDFDAATHRVRGRPVEALGAIARSVEGAQFAVSDDGMLVYAPGGDDARGALVWVTPDGRVDSLGFAAQRYGTFSLSPDGRRVVALVESSGGEYELRVYDLERRTEAKVSTRGRPSIPVWWPDGKRVVYTEFSGDGPPGGLAVRQLVESAGERDTLASGVQITGFSPDTTMAVGTKGFGSGAWIIPLGKGKEAVPLDSFPTAWGPTVSPDGRWIAYTSNEAGQYAVYVAESARPGARQKVSLGFGEEPLWSPRRDELFYRSGSDWYAVPVPPAGSAQFGRPRLLFSGPYINVQERSHEVAPDGRRHLVILGPRRAPATRLRVITDWTSALTARIAAQVAGRP